VLEQKIKDMDH